MIVNKETIKNYYFYSYTFLDDLSFIINPYVCAKNLYEYEYSESELRERIDDSIYLIQEKLLEYGWEGDGEIGIIWLPPFVDVGIEDTWGTYIWHVKQKNNGVSFIASPFPLNFNRLIKQDNNFEQLDQKRILTQENIIENDVNIFKEAVEQSKNDLRNSIKCLENLPKSQEKNSQIIKANLNIHFQGNLVKCLNDFLDSCYLSFLIEAIGNGNQQKIKIKKSSVKLNPHQYISEEEREDYPDNEKIFIRFLTLQSILQSLISDMWKAYKWEPFKKKIEMLFKSINYKPEEDMLFEIQKHVIIRNCIQHHDGDLERDALNQIGRKNIQMKSRSGDYIIEAWKPIEISEHEIYYFIDILNKFADSFLDYTKIRLHNLPKT